MSEPIVGDIAGAGKIVEGLAKLADSKLPNKVYDDAVHEALQETGGTIADVAKSGRYVVRRLLSLGLNRFDEYMKRIESAVAPENRIEADPAVVGPAIKGLSYLEPENPLVELYIALLQKAIDKTKASEVHPAFAKLIDQLSPDEALTLFILKERNDMLTVDYNCSLSDDKRVFPIERLSSPKTYRVSAAHLSSLDLVYLYAGLSPQEEDEIAEGVTTRQSFRMYRYANRYYHTQRASGANLSWYHCIMLSEFGERFAFACIPEGYQALADKSQKGEVQSGYYQGVGAKKEPG